MIPKYLPSYEIAELERTFETAEAENGDHQTIIALLKHIKYQEELIVTTDPIFHICKNNWVPYPAHLCDVGHHKSDLVEMKSTELFATLKAASCKYDLKCYVEELIRHLKHLQVTTTARPYEILPPQIKDCILYIEDTFKCITKTF